MIGQTDPMSTMPPWGTPPGQTPAPASPDVHSSAPTPGAVYAVVVEQQTGTGESMVWRVDPQPFVLPPGSARTEAQEIALDMARTFQPNHPWNKGRRTVLRLGPDAYLVLVEGATKTFHFRVSVAELIR